MTTPASLSTEGRIIAGLAALSMKRKEFVGICKALNVPVSETSVSLSLAGKTTFSQWTGIALLNVMNELLELQKHYEIQMSWASSEGIATRLVERRMLASEATMANTQS
jgi:hypothetical protein